MWKTILNLIFPINCLGCQKEKTWLCDECFAQIPINQESIFQAKSKTLPCLIAASNYSHPLARGLVHRFKYDFVRDLAEPLAKLMTIRLKNVLGNNPKLGERLVLVPVPLHKKRLRWRGFNQACLLAETISRQTNIPMIGDLLVRTKNTLPQAKLPDHRQRKQNIKQAFALAPTLGSDPNKGLTLTGKTIILVDDIATTNSTLKECAFALRPLKPRQIWALVAAKG